MENEISLYPTIGEYYEYNIYELVYEDAYVLYQQEEQNHDLKQINNIIDNNYQLKWISHPNIENIQIKNQFQEIDLIFGDQFKSLSSNNTHFAGLTFENEIKIYNWENQVMRQIGQSLNIDNQFNCFNIDISSNNRILFDCYQNEQLYLMNLSDSQYNIVYSNNSSMPIKTKLQSIVNGTNIYIIYAQYYQNNSILSLFSNKYENLTCWNNNFLDFNIPIKIDPYIYVLTQQQILQFSISSNYTFELQYNFTQDNITNFITIHSYYNYFTYSQCDQIFVQSEFEESFTIISLWGCEKQIILQNNYNQYQFDQSIQTILQNNQFIIFQQNHQIILYQQTKSAVFQYNHIIQTNSLLYFNADNELFSFNQVINTYKIQNPSLLINLTNLQVAGQNDNFSIRCFSQNILKNQNLIKINLQILPKNDTNIYVMFQQNSPQYQYTMLKKITINFISFSGKLLQYSQNNDTNYFNFEQATYNNISKMINKDFYLVQQLQTIQNFNETLLFLIGYKNQQVYIYNCSYIKDFLQYTTFNNISITIKANQLQVAYSIYPEIIIIGLSNNQTICLIQQQYDDNKTFTQSNTTFESEILEFLVTYNNIIILFNNQEIQIMTLDFQNIFTLNQTNINKYFNIEFNPIQIIVNTQLLSSFLYINNIQNIIIVSIQQNSLPIPISLIQVNFTIYKINLVNQQLILSYLCYQNQSICFQVWNVENIPQYYYEKNLCEVDNNDQIRISSDNLFFYVTFADNSVYIYNPSLPYHMSLYYQLNQSFQSTLAIQNQKSFLFDYSIIFQQKAFYQLVQLQTITIQPNQGISKFNFSYPQVIYNYNVTSVLNNSTNQSTPNQSITLLSDFIQFQNKTITINLTKEDQDNRNHHFSYPLNLIVDRQYTNCTINDLSHLTIIDNKFINKLLTQGCLQLGYNNIYNKNIYDAIFSKNSLITSINNQFIILQSNTSINILNSSLTEINYQQLTFSYCLASTSYNDTYYSICEKNTSQYLIILTLNQSGSIVNPNTSKQLPNIFSKIIKIRCVLDQIFILGSFNNQTEFLYWFNQINNTFIQLTQEINHNFDNKYYCQDFSAALFQQTHNQEYTIIIFQIIRYQVFYQIIEVEGENVRINPLIYVIIHYCNFQYSCFQLDKFKYILIINLIGKNVIIFLTDKYNFSYFIRVIINPNNIHSSNYAANVIRTIPNYYNYVCTGNSFYYDGVLMQQFTNGLKYVTGMYYLEKLGSQSINEPILMQGSFFSQLKQYAMIVNEQYPSGIALSLKYSKSEQAVSPQVITFSTTNITCNLKRKTLQFNVNISCSNNFSSGTYDITFNLYQQPSQRRGWIYALLILISLLLFYFYYKVKTKSRDYNINLEIEL
ncbi:unnamed protein product [Paramecium primaurelia]|uniref:Transmembrane protein n=1 Tax=Paramecium primaurelia TaxID=5886 RepID=A0A8S1MNK0_PARPR|nr:unnamed protein product [Paramecium primaurelia]